MITIIAEVPFWDLYLYYIDINLLDNNDVSIAEFEGFYNVFFTMKGGIEVIECVFHELALEFKRQDEDDSFDYVDLLDGLIYDLMGRPIELDRLGIDIPTLADCIHATIGYLTDIHAPEMNQAETFTFEKRNDIFIIKLTGQF